MGLPPGDRELIQIMDAAFASAADRSGEWLVCRPGCTQCCHGAFAINPLDALRLREGMQRLRRQSPERATEIEWRATAWVAEHGATFPGDVETGQLDTSEPAKECFEDFANDAPCPVLDPETGRCDLYEWRPMTCRLFGPPVRTEGPHGENNALGHCELCFEGASEAEIAACEMTVPHDLEQQLIDALVEKGETVVAFAVLHQDAPQKV